MSTIHADLTETRRYIEIEPADTPLEPETVQHAIADLHQTITTRGWRATETYPTYEFLVAATGETGETGSRSLTWYVGVHLDHESDDQDVHDERLEATRRTLSRCLPSSYDLRTTETSYADSLDLPLDEGDAAEEADELIESDREILDELQKGRCTPAVLVDWTGLSKQTIHNRLNVPFSSPLDTSKSPREWPLRTG